MKLNWFSPLPPAATGIAEYTKSLLPGLTAHADVTLWTTQDSWDADLERHADVRHYDPARVPWQDLNQADLSIFHMGNNPYFHAGIWQVSQLHAGVVVIHDLRLQDFFWGVLGRGSGEYVQLMEQTYGPDGGQAARRFVEGTQTIDSLCLSYPLTEAVLTNAIGAIVHTRGGFELVSSHCASSLAYLPFPYPAADPVRFAAWSARREIPAKPPYRLAVFGYINPNRRLPSLLQALGEMPAHQRDQFRLHIYGPIWDSAQVRNLIRHHGLEDLVTLHGPTPANQLDDAIAATDLAINLRFPSMGEASMSQLQVWDHGLPSLVTRTGWYAGLPEDTVRFVDVETEIDDLKRHLAAFAAAPGQFAELGINGRRTLLQKHAQDGYVDNLLDYLQKAREYRGTRALLKTAATVGDDMRQWISEMAVESASKIVAERIRELTKDPNRL
jgi:glycosyltransferase involved in cell wall biosynthesis